MPLLTGNEQKSYCVQIIVCHSRQSGKEIGSQCIEGKLFLVF